MNDTALPVSERAPMAVYCTDLLMEMITYLAVIPRTWSGLEVSLELSL